MKSTPSKSRHEEFQKQLRQASEHEDDMVAVILTAALIDMKLRDLLELRFRKYTKAERSIPGQLARKANLCYCLELFEEDTKNNIRMIVTVRNTFAHDFPKADWTTQKIKSAFNNCREADKVNHLPAEKGTRQHFHLNAFDVLIRLQQAMDTIE